MQYAVPKPYQDHSVPSNYRPMTLRSYIKKLWRGWEMLAL